MSGLQEIPPYLCGCASYAVHENSLHDDDDMREKILVETDNLN